MSYAPGDFVAQTRLGAPGTMVNAYQPGDFVPASVVETWGLAIPEQVVPADGYQPERPAEDSDNRVLWEAYVIGQGTTVEDARAASLDELRGMYDAPEVEPPAHDLPASVAPEGVDGTGVGQVQPVPPAQADSTAPTPEADALPDGPGGDAPARPAESDRKAVWVDYVVVAGADEQWARADDTTKADLMAWTPEG